MRKIFTASTAAVVLAAGGGVAWSQAGSSGSAFTSYLTAAVTRTDVADTTTVTGSVSAATTSDLSFGATALVTSVPVTLSQVVTAGTVLATEGSATLDADVAVAQATADAAVEQQSADTASGTATAVTLADDSVSVINTKASLATAKTNAADTTLTAPYDGVITAVAAVVGESVSGTAVSMRSSTLEVVADVAEADVAALSVNEAGTATFVALGTRTAVATVTSIADAADSTTSTFPVTVTLSAVPTGLLPGMTASVALSSASRSNVLAVPVAAVTGTGDTTTVTVLTNGKPVVTPVTTGLTTSSLVEIASGLTEGQTVVTGTATTSKGTTTTTTGGGLTGTGGLTTGTDTGGPPDMTGGGPGGAPPGN